MKRISGGEHVISKFPHDWTRRWVNFAMWKLFRALLGNFARKCKTPDTVTYVHLIECNHYFYTETEHLKLQTRWKRTEDVLTTGCNGAPGIMALASCICWANMAMFFCWIKLLRPFISNWVFKCGGGWRYLQFSLEQRP